jgi:UrcA family protein
MNRENPLRSVLLRAAAVAGLAIAAGTAGAAPPVRVTATPDGALSTVVRYADLDLASDAGVATLYRRLRGAATTVCRPLQSPVLASRRAWRECHDAALAGAVAGIGNERLAALHGRRKPVQVSRAD